MTRVLVCGGTKYRNYNQLCRVLDALHVKEKFTLVIEGEQNGADKLARRWAEDKGIEVDPFPADWTTYGRAAGPIRNKQMIKLGHPDLVVAFPGNKGTANMIKQAVYHGIRIIEVEADG